MNYHDFMGQVQHRARLADFEDAVRATRTTLETLGERLIGGEPHNLAAQLPREIGLYLERPQHHESFDLAEFYRRISAKEGTDIPTAIYHAHVVMDVLEEAVTPGVIRKAFEQLPADWAQVFVDPQKVDTPGIP